MSNWTTRKCEVPNGTRIEIWDKIPGKRGWSQKVGKVHYHDGVLHMTVKDCEHIDIKPYPPVRLDRGVEQVWRTV